MKKDQLTTIAGAVAAVCAAILLKGGLPTDSTAFTIISVVGSIALGLLGYFSKDKSDTSK
jgi:hypothetical protein